MSERDRWIVTGVIVAALIVALFLTRARGPVHDSGTRGERLMWQTQPVTL